MQLAAIFFGLTALGGLAMLVVRLRGRDLPPLWLALGHGLGAIAGLATLGFFYTQTNLPSLANWALVCFILAALGGLTLFAGFHLRGRPLPVPLILGHGLIAATGLGLLLKAIYG